MKLHLPLFLRKSLLSCIALVAGCTLSSGSLAFADDLVLGAGDELSIDYAAADSIPNLENGSLQLTGDTLLQLLNCGSGDGKTYTLVTDISGLLDAEGNAITLDSSNNAISNYFDTTQPGTGFWAGSALVLTADGTLQLVLHNEEVKDAVVITTRQPSNSLYQHYKGITFRDIRYNGSDSYSGDGGVIESRTVKLSNNGNVVFEGNMVYGSMVDAKGGAIFGHSTTLSNNGSVLFERNTASSSCSSSSDRISSNGGAIYGYNIALNDNGSVEFKENLVSSSYYLSRNFGGAICGVNFVTLSNNGSVLFEKNMSLSSFSNASSSAGAIYGYSSITLSNNVSVAFIENIVSGTSSANGGAICGGSGEGSSTILLSENGSVEFSENATNTSNGSACGGAIYGDSNRTITLSRNGSVVFSENTVYGAFSYGGAIYGATSSTIDLSDNSIVTFSENSVSCAASSPSGSVYSYGGAISACNILKINNNDDVVFRGNYAYSPRDAAGGGAIYFGAYGDFSIQNNSTVVFEDNYALEYNHLSLQSIYAYDTSWSTRSLIVNFSAPENGRIEFRDGIYIDIHNNSDSAFHLNNWYESEESERVAQTGDIIFTGAHVTATNLNAILQKHGLNLSATTGLIRNSRISEIWGTMQLHDGRLIIRDGAIVQADGITVHSSTSGRSTPTLWLYNGELCSYPDSSVGQNIITINNGSALRISAQNKASYSTISLSGGSSLIIDVASAHTDIAALTLSSSSLSLGGPITLQLNVTDALTQGVFYKLLSGISTPGNWSADYITVTSGTDSCNIGFEDLTWDDNTLWLYYDTRPDLVTATWTNDSADGKWNTTSLNWEQDEFDYEYKDGVAVVFGDEGAGTVTLVGDIAPKSVLVDSSQDYTWVADATESGTLTGSMKLTKQGTGTLHIKTSNDFTGGTQIEGGTVVAGTATALGTGAVQLNGGTLEIGAAGMANVISNIGNSALQTSSGIIHALTGIISNSGTLTLSGSFDASALAKSDSDDIYVAVDGTEDKNGSGFLRSGDFNVLVVNGGTVDATAATITWDGTELEMTGGTGFAAGAMLYDTYRILSDYTADALAIHQYNAVSANAKVTLAAGGVLNANDANGVEVTATGGSINLTAGALSGTWTAATVNATGGSLAGRFAGASTLEGTSFNLGSTAVQNDGTLTLSGSFDASGMAPTLTNVDMRVDENGAVSQDGSGFLRSGDFTVLVATGSVDSVGATVTYGGQTLTMNDGTGFGVGTVQYDTYLLKGSDTATVSKITTMAGESLQKIDMQGGTLNVNASTDKLVATGGNIQLSSGTLGGSIGCTAAVAVNGTATISGNNSYTGGTTLSNGNLTITHANALGNAIVSSTGSSSLTVGSSVTLALGSVISNSGTLTLSGSIDASALAKSDSDDIYVDVNGTEDKNGSGFLRSGDFNVLVVNGGTVDASAATITWRGTTLEMTGGAGFAAGAVDYGTYRIVSDHTADALAIHQYNAVSANAKVTLAAGGTLNANDANGVEVTANGGTINLTAGALSGMWSNAIVNAMGGCLTGGFAGDSTLAGTSFNLGGTAVQNSGTLTLSGSFDASGMASVATGVNMRVDEEGVVSQDGSGFLRMGDFTVLVATGTVDSVGATVTYGGQTLTMNGGTGFGVGAVQYDTYLLKGSDSATVSKITTMAGESLQKIDMQGGTLHVNASTDKLMATGGSIQLSAGTLGGSIGGTTAVAVSGTATLSGNNSYTDGTMLSNGNLTITHANALGNAIVSSTGSSSLTVGSSVTLALSSVISNSGTLTLSGSIDVSALAKSDSDDIYVDVNGTEDKNGSGFLRSGDFNVLVVNGGTVDASAATITWRGTTLEMTGGAGFAAGAVDYGTYRILSDHTADALAIHQYNAASANAKVTNNNYINGILEGKSIIIMLLEHIKANEELGEHYYKAKHKGGIYNAYQSRFL